MDKNLGQDDIDALFAAAAGANAALKADGPAAVIPPEKYSFSRAGQISNDQMRAISTVNDLFARNLMHTLGAWLRTPLRVKLVSGEQLPSASFWSGYLRWRTSVRFGWNLWVRWGCWSSTWH